MATTAIAQGASAIWVPGDWNAFFGFGTNILVNVLVLTGLLRFVLKMPDSLVFGRILPATRADAVPQHGLLRLARLSARAENRPHRCLRPAFGHQRAAHVRRHLRGHAADPQQTGDPVQAWEAGLTWVFVQSFVLMIGGFIAPVIRRITPRAALLGSLAGISITFISMRPGLLVFETPLIGIVCFAIILANWFGGVRYFRGVPGGLVAIAAGTIIAWGSNFSASAMAA